jgi:hypothetical protein
MVARRGESLRLGTAHYVVSAHSRRTGIILEKVERRFAAICLHRKETFIDTAIQNLFNKQLARPHIIHHLLIMSDYTCLADRRLCAS